MTNLLIIREEFSPNCTIGSLFVNGAFECYTLELPWKENQRKISCIPPRCYKGIHRESKKYGRHIHIQDVPNRDLILVHIANYPKDILGCIGVGTTKSTDFVGNSKKAFDALMAKLEGEKEINITIKNK